MRENSGRMLHYACVACRRSFKRGAQRFELIKACPNCGANAIDVGRHFKPPRSTDLPQWEEVRFLLQHGFLFLHVSDPERGYVRYPETLAEARVFVERYKDQALSQYIAPVRAALAAAKQGAAADRQTRVSIGRGSRCPGAGGQGVWRQLSACPLGGRRRH